MKPRLVITLLLLVLLPLAMLGWMARLAQRGEEARLRDEFQALLRQRLVDVERVIAEAVGQREREFLRLLEIPPDLPVESLREVARGHHLASALFVLDAKSRLRHPSVEAPSTEEAAFLERSKALWEEGGWRIPSAEEGASPPAQGWRVWYHASGPRFLFWRRLPSGSIAGLEIPASPLVADIIGKLPNSAGHDQARLAWLDSQEHVVYQWGRSEEPGASVQARLTLASPFDGWTLQAQSRDVAAGAQAWQRLLLLAGAGLSLGLLAVYFYRESARESRVAGQRITFVNQVSHELKTPLTNISLYAELAEESLPEDCAEARDKLRVVRKESDRLGRLINNVLTFSKHQRGSLQPKIESCDLDQAVHESLGRFRPSLEEKGLRVEEDLASQASVMIDPDMLEQILANLFSNAEKYARSGGWLGVSSSTDGDRASVRVADRGPGIPASQCERVFEPFFRLSDKLSDGVAGAGIGLGLARDLAEQLGGRLELHCPDEGGCAFTLTLPIHGPTLLPKSHA